MMAARKGQIISYDLMFASTIAVVLLGVVLVASNTVIGSAEARYGEGGKVAEMALSQLVLTSGSPSDWSSMAAETHSLGLAEKRGVLDREKVEGFLELEGLADAHGKRDWLRDQLGLLREGGAYEFRFEVLGSDGSQLYASSKQPAPGNVFVSRRIASLDGSPVIAVLKVWRV